MWAKSVDAWKNTKWARAGDPSFGSAMATSAILMCVLFRGMVSFLRAKREWRTLRAGHIRGSSHLLKETQQRLAQACPFSRPCSSFLPHPPTGGVVSQSAGLPPACGQMLLGKQGWAEGRLAFWTCPHPCSSSLAAASGNGPQAWPFNTVSVLGSDLVDLLSVPGSDHIPYLSSPFLLGKQKGEQW